MKKFLFALTLVTTMLLLGGTALAAGNCRSCGSSDLTMRGSGSWCRWLCNQCGYETALNHNPNSKSSGLSPNSCSGRCTWCGGSAVWSSHTFTTWTLNNDATCTTDGTETARCSNAQCRATTGPRNAPGSALGHNYVETIYRPTCDNIGYTNRTCSRCGDQKNDKVKAPLGHLYGPWTSNGDATHTLGCTRKGCRLGDTVPCVLTTSLVGGVELTRCHICGYVKGEGKQSSMSAVSTVSAVTLDGSALPGELVITVDSAPLEVPLAVDVFYVITAAFHQDGQEVALPSPVSITADLNAYSVSIPNTIFFDVPACDLNWRTIKVVRAEQQTLDGQAKETWQELPFTLDEGILTFETDKTGVFLVMLKIYDAPVAN